MTVREHAHDKEGWLALMADEVVIEDPIGPSVTNPDGNGVRGKEVGSFFDKTIGASQVTVTCEETFPSSSPGRAHSGAELRSRAASWRRAWRVHLPRQ